MLPELFRLWIRRCVSPDLSCARSSLQLSIAPHQIEKAKRVAKWMNLANLIAINSCDWHRLDLVASATGNYEHFGLVIVSVSAAKEVRDQLSRHHTVTTLRIANFLPAHAADLVAHVPVHDAPDQRHASNVIHAVPDKKCGPRRIGRREQKSVDLFRKMLAVGVEKNNPGDLSILFASRSIR